MIVVLDYGMGNLDSVVRGFSKAGTAVKVSADAADIAAASGIVLPGVGAFAEAMRRLRANGLVELLHRRVLDERVPVLGICLGFQLMTSHGEEGDADGLGWLGGATRRFRPAAESGVKIPHMGWNDLQRQSENRLFDGIDPRACFYFAHSYHVTDPVPEAALATSVYGEPFISSASLNGQIFGTQFHPEKSYENGIRILANFAPEGGEMNKVRVMPVLLLKQRGLEKGVKFRDFKYVGCPVNAARVFNRHNVDELVLLDTCATAEGRGPVIDIVHEIARESFMPFTVGGGIRSVDMMRDLLEAGADRVVINTAAVEHPDLIAKGADRFGSQCIVVSIDARRSGSGWEVCSRAASRPTGLDPAAAARAAEEAGAGEILITSIDQDGTLGGYDIDLVRAVSGAVSIPVIACGGAGSVAHLAAGVYEGGASAVAAGAFFLFFGKRRTVLITYPSDDDLRRHFLPEHVRPKDVLPAVTMDEARL